MPQNASNGFDVGQQNVLQGAQAAQGAAPLNRQVLDALGHVAQNANNGFDVGPQNVLQGAQAGKGAAPLNRQLPAAQTAVPVARRTSSNFGTPLDDEASRQRYAKGIPPLPDGSTSCHDCASPSLRTCHS